MKLEEAIEIVEFLGQCVTAGLDDEEKQALALVIEAGKFRLRWEEQEGEDDFPLLPGETVE